MYSFGEYRENYILILYGCLPVSHWTLVQTKGLGIMTGISNDKNIVPGKSYRIPVRSRGEQKISVSNLKLLNHPEEGTSPSVLRGHDSIFICRGNTVTISVPFSSWKHFLVITIANARPLERFRACD